MHTLLPPLPASLSSGRAFSVMATIGPTFEAVEHIADGLHGGCCWIRLPMGYRNRDHISSAKAVYEAKQTTGRECALAVDLPSARPRIACVGTERQVSPGDTLTFGGDAAEIQFAPLSEVIGTIKSDQRLLMLDGRLEFSVSTVSAGQFSAVCRSGVGVIKNGNSLVFPDTDAHYKPVTAEDIDVLVEMASQGCPADWVILSMVTCADDIREAKEMLSKHALDPRFMAKIETRQAVDNAREIIAVADGLLVGRGDLGQVVPWNELPAIQDHLTSMALEWHKPCLVATQSLEIFAETGIPQRCELVDVAHASVSGASGIMLGKETVFSRHPLEAIRLGAALGQTSALPSSSWPSHARRGNNHGSTRRLIAIEGPNGAGKSTVCSRVTERLGAVSMRGVPSLWEDVSLKTRVLSSKHWQAALFHYLAGTIELQADLPAEGNVIIDRCIWSTLAVHATMDPGRIRTVLGALDMVAAEIPFPDITIYLDTDFASCQARIANKPRLEQQWDEVGPTGLSAHKRERDLFAWLAQAGVPIVFVPADSPPESITDNIIKILKL